MCLASADLRWMKLPSASSGGKQAVLSSLADESCTCEGTDSSGLRLCSYPPFTHAVNMYDGMHPVPGGEGPGILSGPRSATDPSNSFGLSRS